ncbi:MAG: hypothetical protein NTW62_00525 [Candidatus Nomurabacteria bacterium]|nr:hypothetical protein [Candidatus Nomurabacteria bacterium]
MQNNKNTIVIILLVIIILILGYVAFLKPQNANQNYGNDNQVPVTNNVTNTPVQNPIITNPPPTISTALPMYVTNQQGWPPVIQTSSVVYSCAPSTGTGDVPTVVTQKIINGKNYCITNFTEGAAGSVYSESTYTVANNTGTKTTHFILHWPNCGVYGGPGDPTYTQCNTNQTNFFSGLDSLVASLM